MKYFCIVLILAGAYVVSGLFDYPTDDDPWFYGVAALWSTVIILAVAVCELVLRSSSLYWSCLSIYIMFIELCSLWIDFLAVLGGLNSASFFYWHWDIMMDTIAVLEFIGLLLWILIYGVFNRLFIYHTARIYSANIYRYVNNKVLYRHQKSH